MTERYSALAHAAAQPMEPRDAPAVLIVAPVEGSVSAHLDARTFVDLQRLLIWISGVPIRERIHDAVDALLDELEEPAS